MIKKEVIRLAISGVNVQLAQEELKASKGNKLSAERVKLLTEQYKELLEMGFNRKDLDEEL